jgi:hypothetical protein
MLTHILLIIYPPERSHYRGSPGTSHAANTFGELLSTPSQPRHLQRLLVVEPWKDPR